MKIQFSFPQMSGSESDDNPVDEAAAALHDLNIEPRQGREYTRHQYLNYFSVSNLLRFPNRLLGFRAVLIQYPGLTADEIREQNLTRMTGSQSGASYFGDIMTRCQITPNLGHYAGVQSTLLFLDRVYGFDNIRAWSDVETSMGWCLFWATE